tara:strand:- start:251 stop:454 length:204 start_codon:yes stop_codon:yes gene_type:complete
MQFEKGDNIEERIDNAFVMFYFNLLSGDWTIEYCESELTKHVELEEYEIAEGIKKAINFKKYGNSLV